MLIREVRPDDAAEWLRMRVLLWPEEGGPAGEDDGTARQEHAADIARFFAGETLASCPGGAEAVVLVADRGDGRLAGFVEAGLRPFAAGCDTRPVGYVEGWFVDGDVRLAGVGRALIAAVERWTQARGCRELASDCEVDNATSVLAHRALGFAEVETVVLFRKPLPP